MNFFCFCFAAELRRNVLCGKAATKKCINNFALINSLKSAQQIKTGFQSFHYKNLVVVAVVDHQKLIKIDY